MLIDLRPSRVDRILQDHPKLKPSSMVSKAEGDRYWSLYHDKITENTNETYGEAMSLPDCLSDNLAKFGGS